MAYVVDLGGVWGGMASGTAPAVWTQGPVGGMDSGTAPAVWTQGPSTSFVYTR